MKIRLTCVQCHASFLVTDEQLGQVIACPKCGKSSRMPATIDEVARRSALAASALAASAAPSPEVPPTDTPPTAVPVHPVVSDEEDDEEHARLLRRRRNRRRLIPFLLGAVGGLVVAAFVLMPMLRRPAEPIADPGPVDPVEQTSRAFLIALVSGDERAISRLSTLTDPPAIASFGDPLRDPSADEELRGSFAPIADLNRRISETMTYDPAIDRFKNANPLGVAADFMDEAEQLRKDQEADGIFARIAGGTADEQLDAAVEFAEQFAGLMQVNLPRTEIVPTYAQLVEDADPPLPPEAEALALDFGGRKDSWDALLGRPFFTIRADGPFVLDRAEVVAPVRDRLAEPTDPDRLLRLSLVRFRLDAIDTGWRVVSARREDPRPTDSPAEPTDEPTQGEPFTSPGMEDLP